MRFVQEKLERRVQELSQLRYRERAPLSSIRIVSGAQSLEEAECSEGMAVKVGDRWGGRDETRWFVGDLVVPEPWIGKEVVGLFRLGDTGGGNCSGYEALVYLNGVPAQALDRNHEELFFPTALVEDEEPFKLAIKAWSGLTPPDGNHNPFDHRIDRLEWAFLDPETDDLYYSSKHLLEAAACMEETSYEKQALLTAVDEAYLLLDWSNPGSQDFYDSVKEALIELKLRGDAISRSKVPQVTAVGHCHIDVAWLWRLKHTREKSARSFSTVLMLMERYPEYVFFQSQPQLYAYLKEDYPEIYAQIKQKIAENRWEASGAMWLESDCNIPSGESLVRQLLAGKRFFKEEFGVDNRVLWLPDVFGYSWALPQILKKSGIDYFMTTKISWSQYNRFPQDTFKWSGIDGTEILTHFITTPNNDDSWYYTYNGNVSASSVKGLWNNYRQKDINDELLLAYGWGDGGGGPTRDMLEAIRRFEAMPGMPSVKQGKVEPFFEQLEERVRSRRELPLWDGELYLEYHRGTYTSQAYNKRMNRNLEALLHTAESINAMALAQNAGHEYPADLLRNSWTIVLRNQFHDIIPGSSIKEVYEDSRLEYAEALDFAEKALEKGISEIELISETGESGVSGHDVIITYRVFNTLGWKRSFLVEIPMREEDGEFEWSLMDGRRLSSQFVPGIGGAAGKMYVQVNNVPSYGYATISGKPIEEMKSEITINSPLIRMEKNEIETPFYLMKLNDSGQLISLFDKRQAREVIMQGEAANALQVFEDKPLAHDAWDIDIFYQDKMREVRELTSCSVEESGPLRGVLKLHWTYNRSHIEQKIIVYADHPRIDFKTRVGWRESQQLLKVAFPVNIRSTKATYEIQFGNVERPTHWNTSWDWARFESVAQRWVDLSEGGYGVSLLNDCKYGHDIRNHTIRLSLIKSATSPDPTADQGEHEFTYSLYPHEGNWLEAETHRSACELNLPLFAVPIANRSIVSRSDSFGLIESDQSNIMIDTVKKAEDGQSLVVRLYEYGGIRSKVRLRLDNSWAIGADIEETDLMEDNAELLLQNLQEPIINTFLKPYEIKTLRIGKSIRKTD
ncbi:alpha-mannosidase [Cohnella sp. NL03-T5]|uniref:alpha-mannosidase n=1 Tax=Cohnella silvisoli TaxID=2873699 RepID=UPI001E595D8B|nr:alpha-mannosidase [Cohnella silvisoli]MCD9021539.1 alpha-mannosidase [Cohnella silvisoli]